MKNIRTSLLLGPSITMAFLLVMLLMGCQASNTTKGGAIGAGAGAAIGGIIGHQSDNTVVGPIIAAAVGGTTGALIGRHMDKQAEELKKDLQGATVERVGEGILMTFDSGLLFKHDSFGLERTTKDNLSQLSKTLNKYDDTNILIEGHTDSTGEDAYNLSLSQKRAREVEGFLVSQRRMGQVTGIPKQAERDERVAFASAKTDRSPLHQSENKNLWHGFPSTRWR